jgi:hypothetical protein
MSFLPSDFNPMVLILGTPADLRILSRTLRAFARVPAEVRLHENAGFGPTDTRVTLSPAVQAKGIEPVSLADKTFSWSLDAGTAEYFAELIDELTAPAMRSGSERLECCRIDEIPVKVSHGEFTDDFLLVKESDDGSIGVRRSAEPTLVTFRS